MTLRGPSRNIRDWCLVMEPHMLTMVRFGFLSFTSRIQGASTVLKDCSAHFVVRVFKGDLKDLVWRG